MAIKQHDRQYDLVVFGATGYTGRLTCEHIASHLPTDLRWAVAGRSASKLQALVDSCNKVNPDRVPPAVEVADVNSDESVTALAKKAYVIITSVGPYCMYGEGLFKACAENGTHYVDCTGEFPWVHRMINKYEKTAKASGARMFPQTGVESAPSDLLTWLLAKHIRETMGEKTAEVFISIHELKSIPSGGTLASVLNLFNYFSLLDVRAAGRPYALSPVPHKEPSRPGRPFLSTLLGPRSLPILGTVTTSIAGGTDGSQVERTWGLLSSTPSLQKEFYGPNFTWAQYYRVGSWFQGLAVHWGLVMGGFFIAFVPPVRLLLKKLVYQPGEGPDTNSVGGERIEYRGTAKPDSGTKSNQRAFCTGSFDGGLYYLTGLFIAQAAITILEDDPDLKGGIYTPACLGQSYIDRVHNAGFRMNVTTVEE